MTIKNDMPLAPLTSFGVGGHAEKFVEVFNSAELEEFLNENGNGPDWILGFGANTLISDKGLPGVTLRINGGEITRDGDIFVADAGVNWNELVDATTEAGLWGLELMTGIPGGVGAAVFINITAYGQSAGDRIRWVDAWDPDTKQTIRFEGQELGWEYKKSIFQGGKGQGMIILRAAFELSTSKTTELTYQSAIDVATELNLDVNLLKDRRSIILEARERTGAIHRKEQNKNAGSFFRNPTVTAEQADHIVQFDEFGKTADQVKKMNKAHGGDEKRVSAAFVMLAAGFKRGQSWGQVKLNDKNLLKIENAGTATAQEIFDVAQNIIDTCQKELGVTLVTEAQILGDFS